MDHPRTSVKVGLLVIVAAVCLMGIGNALGQLIDRTQAPNIANEGIAKSLDEQLGVGRGDILTQNSSAFVIARDPFRAIRRGRQLFQRKFTRTQGQGPGVGDGHGDIQVRDGIGAGLADSCATCHGRPRGSAGFGGNVVTRPDSRDAPHLFGVGLKEMLADEITGDLRAIRAQALDRARRQGVVVKARLLSKGIDFGQLVARPDGSVDTSGIEGVDADLRVRPFRAHGGNFSLRSFAVGAFHVRDLVAVDFFTGPTAQLRVLFVLVVLAHQRRRVLHVNVTEHPTAAWTAQQVVETFPNDSAPSYLLRDRDRIYGPAFRHRLKGMGLREVWDSVRCCSQVPIGEPPARSSSTGCRHHGSVTNGEGLTWRSSPRAVPRV
jgi:hypothetical protein